MYSKNDLAGDTESIAMDALGFGNYTMLIRGEDNSAGAFHLDVYLASDALPDAPKPLRLGNLCRSKDDPTRPPPLT